MRMITRMVALIQVTARTDSRGLPIGRTTKCHAITQPGYQGPFGPVETWTLCNRLIHHSPDTRIIGPWHEDTFRASGDTCLLCRRAFGTADPDLIDMVRTYAHRMCEAGTGQVNP